MQRIVMPVLVGVMGVMLVGCSATNPRREAMAAETRVFRVGIVLDQWHFAAAHGLFDLYFEQMSNDAVFLGADASERWTRDEFMAYARRHFANGKGWAYTPVERHVALSDDGGTAWVDEILKSEKYGTLRGTGVLVRVGEDWKIAQYSLTFLVPNEKAGAVVGVIEGQWAGGAGCCG